MNKPDLTTSPIAQLRPTMNPYRHAAAMVLERLCWDLTLESFRSRRKIKGWKDRFLNQKAVIVCNGPSLLQTDFSLLRNMFSIGMNKINLLYEKSDFRPSIVVAINQFVIEQNAVFFNETSTPLFIHKNGRRLIKARENVAFLHSSGQPRLARDCSISINQGHTVTVASMQLAFHLGFRDVALVGCDHSFATKGPANQIVESGETDASHFDSRYFSGGQRWELPDLAACEYYYSLASDMFQCFGGRIVNCTEGGKLEIFPRMSLEEWTSEKSVVDSIGQC